MSDEADDYKERTFVYLGPCTLKGGKPGAEYRELIGGRLGDRIALERKGIKGEIGGVYLMPVSNDGLRFRTAQMRFDRMWPIGEDLLTWRTAASVLLAKERAAKAEKAEVAKAKSEALAGLEPLRALYRTTDERGRRLIEVMALEYLRR